MFCELCRNASKDNALACGSDNFRTSTITRHISHPDHHLLLTAKTMNKSTEVAFQRSFDLESQAVVTAMKAVYYIAKEHLPLTKYTSLINLFKSVKAEHIDYLKGGESTDYDSSYAALEFLEAISNHFTEEINTKLASASVITLLCDESTDIATHKKLSLWARVINIDQKIIVPETLFLSDVFLEKGDGVTIAEAIKKELSDRGVVFSKVMGLGTDGATVMTGQNMGVTGLLLRENPQMLNVHCLAHRVALVTSQAAQYFPVLKDFQQTLTNMFYYFNESSNKVQTLEELQKILNLPILKIREIHEVRWLSFFEALLSVYRTFPALLAYFDSIKKQKDPKGEGIAKKLASKKFIYLTCLMLDVLAPVMVLSQQFQKQDLDPAMVSVHLDTCKSSLNKISNGELFESSYLKTLDTDIDTSKKSYKGYRIDMTQEPANLCKQLVNKVLQNIDARFPQLDILSAFGVLGMRPISFLGNDELSNWGNDKIDILVNQYGQAKSHEWKCQGGESSIKTVEPFIDPDNTRAEWDSCKRTVIAEMFPRDNMVTLWKLICQYHGDKFPNLIKLASLALTCPTNTADCERSFSVQNYITCQRRASISAITCDHLMRVCICGPSMQQMNFENAVNIWKKKKNRFLFAKK